ncbi:MAG TPA: helix-turn-helix domain-containing protein [Anaerolineae bacterium]|nr:helix-turn-helix domain-containing protein [Anaerolineae bacterium]
MTVHVRSDHTERGPSFSLAAEVGLSKNTLNRLAEGKTDRIDFLTLDKLCRYFQCDVGDLLTYEADR